MFLAIWYAGSLIALNKQPHKVQVIIMHSHNHCSMNMHYTWHDNWNGLDYYASCKCWWIVKVGCCVFYTLGCMPYHSTLMPMQICTMSFCLPYLCIRFLQLISLVPTDPRVLQRVGEMYDSDDDRSQAFQYHYESFRYSPTNIDVISWLGAYYMESRFADKATYYFERAALIQPSQINWQLMVASCHRKSG